LNVLLFNLFSKKCWDLKEKVDKRQTVLVNFRTKHAQKYNPSTNSMPGKYGKQLISLKDKFWGIQDDYTENLLVFQDIKGEEETIRQEMIEV